MTEVSNEIDVLETLRESIANAKKLHETIDELFTEFTQMETVEGAASFLRGLPEEYQHNLREVLEAEHMKN